MKRKRWHSMAILPATLVALVACAGPTEPQAVAETATPPVVPTVPADRDGTVPDPGCNFQGGKYGHIKC